MFQALLFAAIAGPRHMAPDMAAATAKRPRLVVVISIDQFRADYLERFASHYLPAKQGTKVGGFQYLKSAGANYVDSHYMHMPTYTGPGHATILTGSVPALNGIVDNDWFDRNTKKRVYCTDDAIVETVGGASGPMSPRNLKVTTVGDELKMATAGKAKVVGISFKDRAAILMAGHAADAVIWFDGGNGKWVSSTFYAPNKKLPSWVNAVNGKNTPDEDAKKTWTPYLKDSDYALTRLAPFVKGGSAPPIFSHKIAGADNKETFKNFTTSSFGQDYLIATCEAAVYGESLGQDEVSDILCINLATNDYIGHVYGPNSSEVMDISVRTDRLLSDFFNFLNRKVPGGLANVAIVVTADHGVAPIPEEARDIYRMADVLRIPEAKFKAAIEFAMAKKYGDGKWVLAAIPHIYLDQDLLAKNGISIKEAQETAATAARSIDGIYAAFTAEDIMHNALPAWPWTFRVANGFYPKYCGDVMVFEAPGNLFGSGTGTSHGTPWAYDTHVPLLLFGPGIKAGNYPERVSQCDIAPTLCRMLGIEQPSGSVGKLLERALGN